MRKNGFSLVETMMVLAVAGTIVLVGWPRLSSALARTDLRGARGALISLYNRARSAALEGSRVATLNLSGSRVWITATPRLNGGAGVDTVGPVEDFGARFGVTVSATPVSAIPIDPRGLGSIGATLYVSKNGLTDSVLVSGYGRITR
ncbi:MAG TPA: prepilin-type N-terminal cleavage/methylation domain-containing protein [Gemmatimonadales bacterium]|nr:prepilin-type N-terminal cleavage/methylation domain-containing protein [Gemmatimonadales bacterium]